MNKPYCGTLRKDWRWHGHGRYAGNPALILSPPSCWQLACMFVQAVCPCPSYSSKAYAFRRLFVQLISAWRWWGRAREEKAFILIHISIFLSSLTSPQRLQQAFRQWPLLASQRSPRLASKRSPRLTSQRSLLLAFPPQLQLVSRLSFPLFFRQ